MLILFAGLPGTGKTTLARAYSEAIGAVHLNSDVLRRDLGLMGDYRPEAKAHVYTNLLARAREALLQGKTVVVDSTFYKAAIRQPFLELANACKIPVYWIETTASETVLRQRLSRPRLDSEADFAVYETIRAQFEPLPKDKLTIHTDEEDLVAAVAKISKYISNYDQ